MRDGRAETRHVFIEGNDIVRRFRGSDQFQIAELGFGTGLNFFETLLQLERNVNKNSALRFISFEAFPLPKEMALTALASWPEVLAIAEIWLDQVSDTPGWQDVQIGTTTLSLAIGDANALIHEIQTPVDAWYLDGFSPAKNPELWGEDLMLAIGEKTKAGGTFATYSAAGYVRKRLATAGFKVERVPGFGTKRHMSVGKKETG